MAECITPLISADDIRRRVAELAGQIDKDYAGSPLTVMGILNGSFIFLSDLVRQMKTECVIDFIGVESYRDGTAAGELKVLKEPQVSIEDQCVLVVDDILDKGNTLQLIHDLLLQGNPRDVRICVMLSKQCQRATQIQADYIGFDVPDAFVVGYGLDYAGQYRQLGYVGVIEKDSP